MLPMRPVFGSKPMREALAPLVISTRYSALASSSTSMLPVLLADTTCRSMTMGAASMASRMPSLSSSTSMASTTPSPSLSGSTVTRVFTPWLTPPTSSVRIVVIRRTVSTSGSWASARKATARKAASYWAGVAVPVSTMRLSVDPASTVMPAGRAAVSTVSRSPGAATSRTISMDATSPSAAIATSGEAMATASPFSTNRAAWPRSCSTAAKVSVSSSSSPPVVCAWTSRVSVGTKTAQSLAPPALVRNTVPEAMVAPSAGVTVPPATMVRAPLGSCTVASPPDQVRTMSFSPAAAGPLVRTRPSRRVFTSAAAWNETPRASPPVADAGQVTVTPSAPDVMAGVPKPADDRPVTSKLPVARSSAVLKPPTGLPCPIWEAVALPAVAGRAGASVASRSSVGAPSVPSKDAAVTAAVSTAPCTVSRSQSPPRRTAPVGSSEAATSAPVASARAATAAVPRAPAPKSQP